MYKIQLPQKNIISAIAALVSFCCIGQSKIIDGKLSENIKSDSIYFLSPSIDTKYFENPFFAAAIDNDNFQLLHHFSFPQMFCMRLKSETGRIPYRRGFYFIDNSAQSITIDPNQIGGEVKGNSGDEYKNVFVPFFIGELSNENNINSLMYLKPEEFDQKLLAYAQQHPNSNVALWFLIKDFSDSGYSDLRLQILHSFSSQIKSDKLWKMIESDFKNVRIKMHEIFPDLPLQNTHLQSVVLKIPNAKFTLIDFWFSRCKPCLEQLPSIINVYEKYNSKGFNVIGISTDKTKDIEIWNQRIIERQIPWANYLDENSKECLIERINMFPTNFLLDQNGKVIQKDIQPDELEKFLRDNI
jgi:thiol-disulfide isomerase/thioredoxin